MDDVYEQSCALTLAKPLAKVLNSFVRTDDLVDFYLHDFCKMMHKSKHGNEQEYEV